MMQIPSDTCEWLTVLRGLSRSERASRIAAERDPDGALIDIADATAGDVGHDATQAIESLHLLMTIADDLGLQHARARIRRSTCRALAYVGRFDDSIAMARAAIEIAESSRDWSEAGRARLASMHGLCELGRLTEAVDTGTAARHVLERTNDPHLVARADINLGIAHYRNDQPQRAVDCFDRARGPLASEPMMIASLENSRGEALLALNDFDGASEAFDRACHGFEKAGHTLNAAIAEGNLADLEYRRGRLEQALARFEHSRRRLSSDDMLVHRARLVSEQAEAKSNLGLVDEAIAEYQRVIPDLDRHGLSLEAARARAGLGEALVRMRRFDEAMTMLSAAAAQYEDLGHETSRARVDLKRAHLMLAMDQMDRAAALVGRAGNVLRDLPADAAMARHVAALIALQQGENELANAEACAGMALIRDSGLAPLEADMLTARGAALQRLGRPEEAIDTLRDAVRRIERVRGMLQADRFRAAFLGDRTRPYEQLTQLLLDKGTDDAFAEAFGIVEKAKSRTLLEHMRGMYEALPADANGDPHTAHMISELAALQEKLNVYYSRVADGDASTDVRQEMHETEQELALLESRLGATRSVANLRSPTQSLRSVQRALADGETVIEYFAVGNEISAFVINADAATVARTLCPCDEVVDALRQVQFQMNRALRPGVLESPRADRMIDDARHALLGLHALLIAGIDIPQSTTRLIVVPHGPLHVAPFASIWNGDSYLVQRFEITTAPSASVWSELTCAEQRGDGDAAVFGCGDDIATNIEQEARAVARMLGTQPCLGSDATAESLRTAAGHARLMHIAAHGRFATDGSHGSGLKLADRWITLRDIAQLHMDADLVVLSGCETGVGDVARGDEISGLIRSFLSAGARAVIGSAWRVDDAATTGFMHGFYQGLQRKKSLGLGVSSLIRDVQRDMIQHGFHPALWAPFFQVGR